MLREFRFWGGKGCSNVLYGKECDIMWTAAYTRWMDGYDGINIRGKLRFLYFKLWMLYLGSY